MLEELARAAKERSIRSLPRFSPKLEAKIAEEIAKYTQVERRFKIAAVEEFAETLCAFFEEGVGGLRRGRLLASHALGSDLQALELRSGRRLAGRRCFEYVPLGLPSLLQPGPPVASTSRTGPDRVA